MAQSPIFVKTEAFAVWLLGHTAGFPRHERFRLAKRIEDALFDFHEHLLRAVKLDDVAGCLAEADVALDRLRTCLRLALEMGYTSNRQYQYAAEHLTEIGRLLGGWQKKVGK
jgi:hypothetical protein